MHEWCLGGYTDKMSIDIRSTTVGTRVQTRMVARTVANIELRPHSNGSSACGASDRSSMLDAALRNIKQNIRADDRVCPYGVSRIAIAFGPSVDAVTPKCLGERLARAIGQGLVSDHQAGGQPEPLVASEQATEGSPLGGAMKALRTRVGTMPSTTVVIVDRLLGGGPPTAEAATHTPRNPSDTRSSKARVSVPQLRHRTVVRYSTGRLAGYGSRHDDHLRHSDDERSLGAMLVVDSDPSAAGTPGLAALAVSSLSGRLGFKVGVISLGADHDLITEIGGVDLDLVVMLIGAEPDDRPSSWSSSTWCIPARLSGAYRSMGIDVLAVSSGAGAGALVGCLEQGASVLFDLNALPSVLHSRSQKDPKARQRPLGGSGNNVPPPSLALMKLTSSERRVLFYLTTGRSPQDIAQDLVVSLATVRSHIRSILRKLGVRSQLAAVAIANSRGHVHDETIGLSQTGTRCEHASIGATGLLPDAKAERRGASS
jgi:DNA-binding CsgD family transcriptional regulator